MKAILYEMHVPMSDMDWIHGCFKTIQELYIPDFGMCFNSEGFAFKTDKKRYKKTKYTEGLPKQPDPIKLKEINMTATDIADIDRIVNQRLTINRLSKKYFNITPYKEG